MRSQEDAIGAVVAAAAGKSMPQDQPCEGAARRHHPVGAGIKDRRAGGAQGKIELIGGIRPGQAGVGRGLVWRRRDMGWRAHQGHNDQKKQEVSHHIGFAPAGPRPA